MPDHGGRGSDIEQDDRCHQRGLHRQEDWLLRMPGRSGGWKVTEKVFGGLPLDFDVIGF